MRGRACAVVPSQGCPARCPAIAPEGVDQAAILGAESRRALLEDRLDAWTVCRSAGADRSVELIRGHSCGTTGRRWDVAPAGRGRGSGRDAPPRRLKRSTGRCPQVALQLGAADHDGGPRPGPSWCACSTALAPASAIQPPPKYGLGPLCCDDLRTSSSGPPAPGSTGRRQWVPGAKALQVLRCPPPPPPPPVVSQFDFGRTANGGTNPCRVGGLDPVPNDGCRGVSATPAPGRDPGVPSPRQRSRLLQRARRPGVPIARRLV